MASRYRQTISKIANSSGAATFVFPAPPMGTVLTGSIGISAAPATSVATATIGGIVWGSWSGNATFGPVQQWAAEEITIVVAGLSAGASFDAVFIGMAEDEQLAAIIWPSALATALATTAVSVSTFHGARLVKTAPQNVLNGATDQITFGASTKDTDLYVVGSGFVVPTGLGGTYLASAVGSWVEGVGVAGVVFVYCRLNGGDRNDLLGQLRAPELDSGQRENIHFSQPIALIPGDTLTLFCTQSTGNTISLDGAATDASGRCSFALTLLGI